MYIYKKFGFKYNRYGTKNRIYINIIIKIF